MRWILALVLTLVVLHAAAEPVESFESFIAHFEAKAVAAGVSRDTYRKATAGLTEDPNIPKLIGGQPEFTTPIWTYLETRASAGRIERGKRAMAQQTGLFSSIAQRYGVDPYILGGIWGIETDYGGVLGNKSEIRPIVRSLATLVHERRGRVDADEAELISALKLVERGPLDAKTLVGSWAGAIGHLQVTPSVILQHGQDGDGDGEIDLHHSLADALATSAEFLNSMGYKSGQDWGFEVSLPEGFDYTLAGREDYHPVSFFAERGVKRVLGRPFADPAQQVFLYVPAGKNGPKFLMTPNYLVLKGYNFSDSYALTVAHLADRLKGSDGFVADWPRGAQLPNLEQRKAIQQALTKLGLYQGAADGRIGPISQAAYARFQQGRGEVADGFITVQSYRDLVAATQ